LNYLFSKINNYLEKEPDKIIVYDIENSWSWAKLVNRAEQYASSILQQESKQKENKIIPVLVDRSGESIAAMLGVLLSGRAFAPLSMNQPIQRILSCIEQIGVNYVLALPENAKKFNTYNTEYPTIVASNAYVKPGTILLEQNINSELLYLLFTSGSTGVPKGVLVNYSNIENTMQWSADMIDWESNDVIGCATNFYFDIAMFDIFTMFYFNVSIAIYSDISAPSTILDESERFSVTSIFSVPLFFSQLLEGFVVSDSRLNSLRRIISGGDFHPPKHILEWMKKYPNINIFNVWGPTETSIVNTMYLITDKDKGSLELGKSPSVGSMHPRMEYVIADNDHKEIDTPGVKGEIIMLGDCVTQGYLGLEELTDKTYFLMKGKRAFATADIGYVNEFGYLFISGRKDSTVKVSGYRIDLGEVESSVVSFDEIYLVAAFVVSVRGHNQLWMAVEAKNKSDNLDIFKIKTFMRNLLPHYMIPKRILLFDKLPTNQNGKLNRNELLNMAKNYS